VNYYEHIGSAQVKFWWTLVRHGPARE
jgi:hypothetical protein